MTDSGKLGHAGTEVKSTLPGFPGNLTPTMEQAVVALRESLTEANILMEQHKKDHELCRYLRARQFDVGKTVELYRKMIQWRKDFGVEKLLGSFRFPEIKQVLENYPTFYHKTDRCGRPIYIERLGKVNVEKLLQHTTLERMLQFHVWGWEVLISKKFPACRKVTQSYINQNFVIIDLLGFSLNHINSNTRSFLKTIAKVDQDYYPEHLSKMLVINVPGFIKVIWAVVRPLLDKRTAVKIELVGRDYKSKLNEYVSDENLPAYLGGTCTCPQCKGDVLYSPGPWVGDDIPMSVLVG